MGGERCRGRTDRGEREEKNVKEWHLTARGDKDPLAFILMDCSLSFGSAGSCCPVDYTAVPVQTES